MYCDNVTRVFPNNIRSDISYYSMNLEYTGLFCGIGAYACEGAGTMFTIRGAMKNRYDLSKIVKFAFGLILIIFLMFNTSFYFVSRQNSYLLGIWKSRNPANRFLVLRSVPTIYECSGFCVLFQSSAFCASVQHIKF